MISTFTHKIIQKSNFVKKDGTCALYLQVFINKSRKQIPLQVFVAPKHFDKSKQRVKKSCANSADLNLIIENTLAAVNDIQISYRLANRSLTMESFVEDFYNPSSKVDFLKFYERELNKQLDLKIIKASTYGQQKSTLGKLKEFKKHVYFYEIDEDFLNRFLAYLKNKLKNKPNTVQTALKNFKKYLHLANKQKIPTPLTYESIKVRRIKSERTFLNSQELNKMYEYYQASYIKESHKLVLRKFLFACFTGLRISDIQALSHENIINGQLVFTSFKSNKLAKINLNKSAFKFINPVDPVFLDNFEDPTINSYLKDIANILSIRKKITFHVARHTFATQFLINGGKIEVLQKLLQHSNIDTTMVYVHIVEESLSDQIHFLDNVLN